MVRTSDNTSLADSATARKGSKEQKEKKVR